MELENQIQDPNFKDKSNLGKKVEIIRFWADEFCSKSSVHGIRYITEKGRHWTEILWWVFAFGLSVCLCAYSIQHLWEEWREHPVVVSFDDKQSSVGTIPFPAVTVCPATKTMLNSLNFSEAVRLMSPGIGDGVIVGDISSQLKAALQICATSYHNFMIKDYHENFADASIYDALRSLNEYADWTIFNSRWLSSSCFDCFQPIYTNIGLCFTFNMLNSLELYTDEVVSDLLTVNNTLNATHWSMEKGYDASNKNDSLYPFRVCAASSTYASLFFDALFNIEDWDENCDGPNKEFYISLHPSDEIPHMWNHFIRIPADYEVFISIKPKLKTTSNGLKNSYTSQQRQCFFNSERRLRFFKVYNQGNCEVECLARLTVLRCNCVPFYLPRDNNTKICSMGTFHCYKRASREFYEANPHKLLPLVEDLHRECNCLPACTSINYDLEMSQIKGGIINYETPLVASRLTIYFKNRHFIAMIRRERFNIAEFIANCGGLFGLFMGASLLSFIELIYYCSLRLIYSMSRKSVDSKPLADLKDNSTISLEQHR